MNEALILPLCDGYRIFERGQARVAVIKNDKRADCRYSFGFWTFSTESEDNKIVFDEMEGYCRNEGISPLIGPLNYATWFDYRLALDNFDLDLFPDCAGSPAQTAFLRGRGYDVISTYNSKIFTADFEKHRLSSVGLTEEFSLEILTQGEVISRAREIYEICTDCFDGADFYSEISFESYRDIYLLPYKNQGIYPYIILIKKGGEPVAFSFSYSVDLTDYYICKTVGIKKAYQSRRSILFTLIDEVLKRCAVSGKTRMVFHYQQKDLFRRFYSDDTVLKTYGLFGKAL